MDVVKVLFVTEVQCRNTSSQIYINKKPEPITKCGQWCGYILK